LNPPSTSSTPLLPNQAALHDLLTPLFEATPDEAAGKLGELESSLIKAGYDTNKELPVSLAAVILSLQIKSGNIPTSSFRLPSMKAIAFYLRKNMPSSLSPGQLNSLRNYEPLDRIDIPRLRKYLRQIVVEGKDEQLAAAWMEYKGRLLDPGQSESHRNEIMARILSACLRCDQRHRGANLQPTIKDIMANLPKPMPTEVFNVILANRANMDEGEVGDQALGIDDNGRHGVECSRLGAAWNAGTAQGAIKDVKSYMIYIEGLGRAGELDQIRKIWGELVNDEVCRKAHEGAWPPIQAFNHMLSATLLVRKIGPPAALELFRIAVDTIPINIVTVNTILRHHARMADVPAMTSLFSQASRMQLKPDVVTYTTLVQGLLRADQFHMAKSVLDKMSDQGLEPNERLCSMLIADLAKSGSQAGLRRAEEMMAEMKRKGMEISVVTWTSLISGYFRGGWDQDAWGAVQRMERTGVRLNRVGYNIIFHEGDRRKEWVMRMFKRMIREGVRPVDDTYLIILAPMVKGKRWDEADAVLEEMNRLGYRPEKGALSTLVRRIHART
jgi:pentatricopeptide repeat protein